MTKSKIVRYGVVGMGPRGRLGWLKTLKLFASIKVVAVCDRIESLAHAGAEAAGLGKENAYLNFDEMLARSDIDAIGICSAPEHQGGLIIKALEAGKHTISEYPPTYSLEDCWGMVLASERSGCKFALTEQRHWMPHVPAWKKLFEEGRLGKVTYAEAQYYHGFPPSYYWING